MTSLAARQHGVVTRAQLQAAGVASTTISRWARVGWLHRRHRGVFAVGHENVTQEGIWLAAVLACGRNAVLSGISAAALYGIRRRRRGDALHVSITTNTSRNPPGVVTHRPRRFDSSDTTSIRGIPTSTATRTVFDLAPVLAAKELRDAFERAEYLEVLDRHRLVELLAGPSGRAGHGRLRTLLAQPAVPLSRTRSSLERLLIRICRERGLPIPLINTSLLDYEVDFLWPEARLVVEVDGNHHVGEQRDRDNRRDLALTRAGYLVRRLSEGAIEDARGVADEVEGLLAERSARRA